MTNSKEGSMFRMGFSEMIISEMIIVVVAVFIAAVISRRGSAF